jgi:hypothetical protein
MYLPWATIFFPYLLYFGRVGYSNMALRAPLSCMHLSIYSLCLDARTQRLDDTLTPHGGNQYRTAG